MRKGAKGVKSTKGGEYVKYGKKSKAAKSFREAFKAAKGKDFKWDGRSYSGKTADDVKKEKAAKASAALKVKNEAAMKSNEADKAAKKESQEIASKKRDSGAYVQKLSEGGKVESNPYGWPSSDSRKR